MNMITAGVFRVKKLKGFKKTYLFTISISKLDYPFLESKEFHVLRNHEIVRVKSDDKFDVPDFLVYRILDKMLELDINKLFGSSFVVLKKNFEIVDIHENGMPGSELL